MPDEDEDDAADEEQRGLEETLEKLGLGAYHWRLLVSLPRGIQCNQLMFRHYAVSGG